MRSKMLFGKTMHARFEPIDHAFTYPIYMWVLDLDELSDLEQKHWFFAYNKLGLLSLYDGDYLRPGEQSIKEKVLGVLSGKSYLSQIRRIECVTTPRYFNYVFNPATFFYCYDDAEEVIAVVLQVNNTFGERHIYIFDDQFRLKEKKVPHYSLPKEFYVSPFNDISGNYELLTAQPNGKVDIRLNITEGDAVLFRSRVWGNTAAVSSASLLRTIIKFPINVFLTTPRILWEAAKLHYAKKLEVQRKPTPPTHQNSFVIRKPTQLELFCRQLFSKKLHNAKIGSLSVEYPDGTLERFGNAQVSDSPQLTILDYKFFPRVVWGGDIAFGEMYCEGLFECSDLTATLRFFVDNFASLTKGKNKTATVVADLSHSVRHFVRRNSLAGSKKNIQAHYDLSNELFSSFLDPSMTYSSAFFATPDDSLEQAQKNKIRMIIEKAKIGSDDYVLEIGSGWGAFAIEAVKQTGCRVKTITLSEEQKKLAEERIAAAGFSDRIEVELCDYRNVSGQFDKIVSIEMLEAVGYQYYETFFGCVDKYLKKDGIAVLQVITLPDQRFDSAKRGTDWIQQYIFPGSTIPSLEALGRAMRKSSQLVVEDVENIGKHYAKTLCLWRRNFEAAWPKVKTLGFDEKFRRTWRYYLSYCEAGFAAGELNDLQIVLSKPNNKSLQVKL